MRFSRQFNFTSRVSAAMLSGACVLAWALATPVRTPASEDASPAGEVLVVLNEGFLNALLDAIVELTPPPKFPLGNRGSEACASEINLAREVKGTRTAVRFADGRITAPVAFRGSYLAPVVGCVRFEGRADTNFELAFDRARQVFTARINVREVKLSNVPSLMSSGLTGLVQDAIDRRVNPVEILRAEQVSTRLPVTKDSPLRLRATEIRHEVTGEELRLRIFYEIVRGQTSSGGSITGERR